MKTAARTLVWHAVPSNERSLLAFLRRAGGQPRFFWQQDEISLAGIGIALQIHAAGENRFSHVQAQAEEWFRGMHAAPQSDTPPWVHPYLLGGFAFSPEHEPAGIWEGYPAAWFILPRYTLLRKGNRTWLLAAAISDSPNPEAARELLWELPAPQARPHTPPALPAVSEYPRRAEWEAAVTQAAQHIRAGRFRKVVLSRRRRLRVQSPVDPLLALDRLRLRYPNCYRFLFEPRPGHAFFGATPELLVSARDGQVRTMALAGSMRRGVTLEEDAELGARLLHSAKDRHEHALVVEAIRNALAPLCQQMDIPAAPRLHRLSNIQHLLTPIHGRLRRGFTPLDVAAALHPTPAVGGLPRAAALAYIRQAEGQARGWYASPIGWLAPDGAATFAVALRCALTTGNEVHLFAGAGIVADSDPAAEWRETALKFRPVQEALVG